MYKYEHLYMYMFDIDKRPRGPVSLTWYLPYIFLYQSMTKGCYMPNINAFRSVIHGKKEVSKILLYKPIYKFVPFKGMVIYDPRDFI